MQSLGLLFAYIWDLAQRGLKSDEAYKSGSNTIRICQNNNVGIKVTVPIICGKWGKLLSDLPSPVGASYVR
jgi:hypothetical protein